MQRWHDDKEENFQSSAVRIYETLQNMRDLLNSSSIVTLFSPSKRGNVNQEQAADIIDNIRKTQREAKLENLDNALKDELANQVLKEQHRQPFQVHVQLRHQNQRGLVCQ